MVDPVTVGAIVVLAPMILFVSGIVVAGVGQCISGVGVGTAGIGACCCAVETGILCAPCIGCVYCMQNYKKDL